MDNINYYKNYVYNDFNLGRFSTSQEMARENSKVDKTNDVLLDPNGKKQSKNKQKAGIPIATDESNKVILSNDESHVLIVGESGSGKTRRTIMPGITTLARAGESMVIADPKGELFRNTSGFLQQHGYNIKILNLRNATQSNLWNPYTVVRELWRKGTRESKNKAEILIADISQTICSSVKSSKDQYWEKSATSLMTAAALLLLRVDALVNFSSVISIANEIIDYATSETVFDDEEYEEDSNSYTRKDVIYRSLFNRAMNGDFGQAFKFAISSFSPSFSRTTATGVSSTLSAACNLIVSSEAIADLTDNTEININELWEKKSAFFIILPDDSEVMHALASIFIKECYSLLLEHADKAKEGKLEKKVNFVLDEFANFAKLSAMVPMLTASRSRNIRFFLVLQSYNQLTNKYTPSEAFTLISNCTTWLFLGGRDLTFIDYLSSISGKYTSLYSNKHWPLVEKETLIYLKKGECLTLDNRKLPWLGELPDWSEYLGSDLNPIKLPETIRRETKELITSLDALLRCEPLRD